MKLFILFILLATPSMAMDNNELQCKVELAKATNECVKASTKWSGNSNWLCITEMRKLFDCEKLK